MQVWGETINHGSFSHKKNNNFENGIIICIHLAALSAATVEYANCISTVLDDTQKYLIV